MTRHDKYSNTFIKIHSQNYQYKYFNGLLSSMIAILIMKRILDSIFARHCGSTLGYDLICIYCDDSIVYLARNTSNNNGITTISSNNNSQTCQSDHVLNGCAINGIGNMDSIDNNNNNNNNNINPLITVITLSNHVWRFYLFFCLSFFLIPFAFLPFMFLVLCKDEITIQ